MMNTTKFNEIPMLEILRENLARIVQQNNLGPEEIIVRAFPLSLEEAIGNPEDRDYPLITGRERLMQAEFKNSLGQAFTDMYGDFNGRLSDIMEMDLTNNFRRALFISSLNAITKHLGLITKTIHCKNEEPRECSYELVKYVEKNYGHPKIAFIGFQPRMVEALSSRFELKITDMDEDNIGTEKFGTIICSPENIREHLNWCDIALVTGSTIVNNTIDQFSVSKPVVYYGITISGVAKLLGLNHFCYYGH